MKDRGTYLKVGGNNVKVGGSEALKSTKSKNSINWSKLGKSERLYTEIMHCQYFDSDTCLLVAMSCTGFTT